MKPEIKSKPKLALKKKSIMISAAISIFLVTTLLFFMMTYRYIEEGEVRVISNSYTTRISNLEDSIQLAVKRLYETDLNYKFKIERENISDITYDKITFSTVLQKNGKGYDNLSIHLSNLSAFLKENLINVRLDNDTLSTLSGRVFETGHKIKFYKQNITSSSGEVLVIYYNESGKNKISLKSIDITISGPEIMTTTRWNCTRTPCPVQNSPPVGDQLFNLIVDSTVYPSYDPDAYENQTIQPFRISDNSIYNISITNSTVQFLNITLDKEKIIITDINGDHNIIVSMYMNITNTDNRFIINKKVLNISLPGFEVEKKSKIEFN